MPTYKLGKRMVDSLSARPKSYVAYDADLPGFGCRVTHTGAKSWIVEYRPRGGGRRVPKKRVTLGSTRSVTPDEARREAKDILARVRLGEDVAAEKASRRVAPTISELAGRYLAEEVRPTKKSSTAAMYEAHFRRYILPELGAKRAMDVTRSDLTTLHRKIGRNTQVTANRVLTLISGLLSWAVKVGQLPSHSRPTKKGISKFREEGRERFLTPDELSRLGVALREAETVGIPWEPDTGKLTVKHAPRPENRRVKIPSHITAAIRLLLFTGCRLREILHLEWSFVDVERGMLFLPDSKTGRKPVVLSSVALAVLANIPKLSRYVIPGDDLSKHRHDINRPWRALITRANLAGLRLHDLRHTFAATGAGSGLGLPVIAKLLGHRTLETTNRYAHLDFSPVKIAANRIATQLDFALGEKSEVVKNISAESGGEFVERIQTSIH